MAFDRTRTLRGALAGSVAAGVWLAQQPLDRRVFGVDHDDAGLLAALVRRPLPVGVLLHMQNGALFGAVYAAVAPRLPLPAILRGPLAGLAEHLATWPATALVAPKLWTSPQAFAQSAWRHLLFGAVLGELERRLNPSAADPEPVSKEAAASNGHGTVDQLVAAQR